MAEIETETMNLASLKLVKSELNSAIENTTKQLEKFIGNKQADYLAELVSSLQQINGTLALVQLTGADILAKDLCELAQSINTDQTIDDRLLEHLAAGLFVLPRYIEYVLQNQRSMAVLLIPVINDLRGHLRKAYLPESFFYRVQEQLPPLVAVAQIETSAEEFANLVKRFRHMYQVGLLAVLQAKSTKSTMGMMQRALQRLSTICGSLDIGRTWQLGELFLEAMAKGALKPTASRKRLLGAIDRAIKGFQLNQPALDATALNRELLYLLNISQPKSEKLQNFLSKAGVQGPGYTELDVQREMDTLRGPNRATVSSVSAVLQDELNAAKEILELASQAQQADQVDLDQLVAILKKLADILPVVGLTSASTPLREDIAKVQSWQKSGAEATELLQVADTLLYVESRVLALDSLNLTDERAGGLSELDQRQSVTSKSQFAQAQQVVLTEMEAGLTLIKRALNSFAESNYDRAHIKNVATTLTNIRGGMAMMEFQRAARVAAQSAHFIDETLLTNDQPAVLNQLLETFADAIISLEYYVEAIQSGYSADEKVLEVAEESLAALGYPVG